MVKMFGMWDLGGTFGMLEIYGMCDVRVNCM